MKLGYRVVGVVSLSLLVPGWALAGEGAGVAQRGAAVAGATGSGVSKGKVRKSDSAPERPADVAQPAGTVKGQRQGASAGTPRIGIPRCLLRFCLHTLTFPIASLMTNPGPPPSRS